MINISGNNKKLLDKYCLDRNLLDSIYIGYNESDEIKLSNLPPIIKASIEIIDELQKQGQKDIVFTMPESSKSCFLLSLFKFISDVNKGHFNVYYDPNTFITGQRLKINNLIVEFCCMQSYRGKQGITVKCANEETYFIPIEFAPLFQLTDTKRKLTKSIELQNMVRDKRNNNNKRSIISELIEYKTHFNDSVLYLTQINTYTQFLKDFSLNYHDIRDIFLIGKAGTDGEIEIISPGKYSGKPSLILVQDFLLAEKILKNEKYNIRYFIADLYNIAVINNYLDVLDLIKENKDIPGIFICNTPVSFDIEHLKNRKYYIWRWDKPDIAEHLISYHVVTEDEIEIRLSNCANHFIKTDEIIFNDIEEISRILYQYRNQIDSDNTGALSIFESLNRLWIFCLHYIGYMETIERESLQRDLNTIEERLILEERFIESQKLNDYLSLIDLLKSFLKTDFIFPKTSQLKTVLNQYGSYLRKCVLVSDNTNIRSIRHQLYSYLDSDIHNTDFMNISEYTARNTQDYEITIIPGWFGKEKMKKVLYSFQSSKYHVLLYSTELRWKKSHESDWLSRHYYSDNDLITDKLLNNMTKDLIVDIDKEKPAVSEDYYLSDDIDSLLRAIRNRKITSLTKDSADEEPVDAIPVDFIGNTYALFKPNHEVIKVTDIISGLDDKITLIQANDLNIGDFIVIRESQRDLIREIADFILEKTSSTDFRKVSSLWRDAINIFLEFSTIDEFYSALKKEGCIKGFETVKGWIMDDRVISPQDKDDLLKIASATEDNVLCDKLDDVYEAGKIVKSAHIKAGNHLSRILRKSIAYELSKQDIADVYNIWDPIELNIEDVGKVFVYKIIDLGNTIQVNRNMVNKVLIEK